MLAALLARRAPERELGADSFDAVSRVHVLDKGDLVAGCGPLTRDDGGVGQEELPDLVSSATTPGSLGYQTYSVPSVAVLCHDLLLIGDPVPVPSPQSGRVVDTDGIYHLHFESSTLQ